MQQEDLIKKMPRKERERLRRQVELLEAAEKVFRKKGFVNTTIQEISETSEFSVGSIYHMFASKEEIYLALLQMRLEEHLYLLEERIDKAKGPEEKIKVFIEARFQIFSENRSFFRLFFNTTYGPQWDVGATVESDLISRYEEHLALLAGIIEEGVRLKIFSGNDPFGMALAIEGMINAFVGYWIRHKDKEFTYPDTGTIESVFFRGILKKEKKK